MVIKSQKGSALVLALIIGFLGTIIGTTLYTVSSANARQVQERSNQLQADYLAKSGVSIALGIIVNNLDDNNGDYLTDGGDPAEYWGGLDGGVGDFETDDYSINFKIKLEDGYYYIESTGIVRGNGQQGSGTSTSQSTSKAYFKISKETIATGGNGGTGKAPALNKIYAVGVNENGKAIELSGNSFISGDTAIKTASSKDDYSDIISFSDDNNSFIRGKLSIGPKNFPPTPLPIFPNFPTDLGNKGSISSANYRYSSLFSLLLGTGNRNYSISASGEYSSITVPNNCTLTINVGDDDIEIKTGTLRVEGNGKIFIGTNQNTGGWRYMNIGYGFGYWHYRVINQWKWNGHGLVVLYVSDSLSISDGGTINLAKKDNGHWSFFNWFDNYNIYGSTYFNYKNNGYGVDYNSLVMYYNGTDAIDVGESSAIAGSIFARTANFNIHESGMITGNIVSGGNSIIVEDGSRVNAGAIYAPLASLKVDNSRVRGAVVANDITIKDDSKHDKTKGKHKKSDIFDDNGNYGFNGIWRDYDDCIGKYWDIGEDSNEDYCYDFYSLDKMIEYFTKWHIHYKFGHNLPNDKGASYIIYNNLKYNDKKVNDDYDMQAKDFFEQLTWPVASVFQSGEWYDGK